MKNISINLQNHLNSEVTNIATCWKLTRLDNVIQAFTSHDQDIIFEGVTYQANSGFTPSDISNNYDIEADNLQIEGVIDSVNITEQDINNGVYDFAAIEIFAVNYADLTQGRVLLKTGKISDIEMRDGNFSAEIRGLSDRLSQNIGQIYSPLCRANLGDNKCQVNLASNYSFSDVVSNITSKSVFYETNLNQNNSYFNFGKVTFTSGLNNGLAMEVKSYQDGKIELFLPMPYDINIGDSFDIITGCDKKITTCAQKFNNAINFRGEPHVPGTDKMLEIV
ncbi:MAG: DUF2163 domain-containing protein [Pseudomonadota bacterium]